SLGLGEPRAISASHGDGVSDLIDHALSYLGAPEAESLEDEPEDELFPDDGPPDIDLEEIEDEPLAEPIQHRIKLAVVGRPNVGKSTLINTLLGEERLVAFDLPGTTRDAIEVEFERKGKSYTLIDTAGLRRRGKVFEAIEKFSVIKTLQAIEASNVVC